MDTTTSSNNSFKFKIHKAGFAAFPNDLLDRVFCVDLHPAGKLLILLVYRYSQGYLNQSVEFKKYELDQILPINPHNLKMLISGMVNLNILKGGPKTVRKNGYIESYELWVNTNFFEWDISIPSKNRKIIYGFYEQARANKTYHTLSRRNQKSGNRGNESREGCRW